MCVVFVEQFVPQLWNKLGVFCGFMCVFVEVYRGKMKNPAFVGGEGVIRIGLSHPYQPLNQ
jgi:hypothetical protein